MRQVLFAAFFTLVPACAFANAQLARLMDLIAVDQYVEISQSEGLAEAGSLSQDMLGRPAGAAFMQQMRGIYNASRMRATIEGALSDLLTPEEIDIAILFFGSDVGQRITELEVTARRAMSDEDVESAARDAWEQAAEFAPELKEKIEAVKVEIDLVERNVAGALNSNLKFFQGLRDGQALDMSEEDVLAQVWSGEPDIRADTEGWLGGYLLLAYRPLEDGDLDRYLTFWKTPQGQALNTAVFEGFNRLYDEIAYATGRVIAVNMSSEDL